MGSRSMVAAISLQDPSGSQHFWPVPRSQWRRRRFRSFGTCSDYLNDWGADSPSVALLAQSDGDLRFSHDALGISFLPHPPPGLLF
nr:hypothetical protein Iba_chr13eCG9110 [Ipomoea batatas]